MHCKHKETSFVLSYARLHKQFKEFCLCLFYLHGNNFWGVPIAGKNFSLSLLQVFFPLTFHVTYQLVYVEVEINHTDCTFYKL